MHAIVLAAAALTAGHYDIDVHIKVKAKHWIRSEPDLVVALVDAGQQVDACRIESAASGDCHFEAMLDDPQKLELVLVDRDGSATLPASATTGTLVEMDTHGEVKAAEIVLVPGRNWLLVRFAGLGGGIAAALLAMRGFKKKLFVAEPGPPRCAHCDKRIAENALRCEHCGAAQ